MSVITSPSERSPAQSPRSPLPEARHPATATAPASPARGGPALPALFALTMFVGAALLFVVQPMIARMVLPLLGGSPAVWNTCMVFFQAALLAGYAYAHASASWLGVRRQTILHVCLLGLPLLLLPFGITEGMVRSLPSEANPIAWLLGLLLVLVGLPFFVVSTTAPLLQRWFAGTGHPSAADPYYLYAASNVGSMLALLGYPLLIEPNLRLAQQSQAWALGYVLLVFLTTCCAIPAWRSGGASAPATIPPDPAAGAARPSARDWLGWIALAFVPSSLLLGVTTYMTTDIASIPLLWVIPLALYLLTFILVFARRPWPPHAWMVRALPMAVVVWIVSLSLRSTQWVFIPLHLLTFFLAAMVCHGELVRRRPAPKHLTAFYLAMSIGGVLGGVFNALVAPLVFDRVVEYPLAMLLACLALPAAVGRSTTGQRLRDVLLPLVVGLVLAGAIKVLWGHTSGTYGGLARIGVLMAPLIVAYSFKDRPIRFALGLGAILVATGLMIGEGRVLHQERSFFGVLRLVEVPDGPFHRLMHGSTIHGQQSLDPDLRDVPLTYYHPTGPMGQVFEAFDSGTAPPAVALVGLGAGSLMSYAEPGQRWTVYEIDPAVVRIARDPDAFTYLRDHQADALEIVLGDARLRLRDAPDHGFGLIVLDAFSSDAIPLHLITREALDLYRSKLAEGGLLAFHISNRYINLVPVLEALARDANLTPLFRRDLDLSPEDRDAGKTPSLWFVMARSESDLGPLLDAPQWQRPNAAPGQPVWTDDHSSIIQNFIFRLR